MLRFVKWAVIPAVVCLAATFGTASDAEAAGWGISVNSGYSGNYCAPSYGVRYGAAYSPYGNYGRAPARVYRYPAYYPTSSFYFNYGGHGGHHGHHNNHHGHHDDHHGHGGHH
jgi:hypothetical protein